MYDTLIIHGSFGSPYENWLGWLHDELESLGRHPLVPYFPGPEEQNLSNWVKCLDAYKDSLVDKPDIYAHSLGPAFIVDYCVNKSFKVGKAVFVAPFYGLLGIEEFDGINKSFFCDESYLSDFKGLADEVICVYSDDDPYVPQNLSEKFTALTGGRAEVVPKGKHLNSSAGYSEFPLLLEL